MRQAIEIEIVIRNLERGKRRHPKTPGDPEYQQGLKSGLVIALDYAIKQLQEVLNGTLDSSRISETPSGQAEQIQREEDQS